MSTVYSLALGVYLDPLSLNHMITKVSLGHLVCNTFLKKNTLVKNLHSILLLTCFSIRILFSNKEPGDPKVKLDSKAIKILKAGHAFKTQMKSGSSGRGLVVQDVKAPTSVVWKKILDYDNYAKMVPKTVESKNYNVENKKNHQIIYTRMKVGFPKLKLQFFVKHVFYPQLNSLTWTLDYSKKSDFNDSCGYWYVVPVPDDKTMSRVYYSVQVSMFDWVPKFVVDFMSTKALTDATGWVKKYSELEYEKERDMNQVALDQKESSPQKKRNGVFQILLGATYSSVVNIDSDIQSAENRENTLVEIGGKRSTEERHIVEDEARNIIFISWTRLGLAATIIFLTLYNIHLAMS